MEFCKYNLNTVLILNLPPTLCNFFERQKICLPYYTFFIVLHVVVISDLIIIMCFTILCDYNLIGAFWIMICQKSKFSSYFIKSSMLKNLFLALSCNLHNLVPIRNLQFDFFETNLCSTQILNLILFSFSYECLQMFDFSNCFYSIILVII